MKIGYARVSTDEQSDNAQIDELEAAECERIYREKYSVDQSYVQNLSV
jgi:DNA invertase Pin-like site-specific DNA recombinase